MSRLNFCYRIPRLNLFLHILSIDIHGNILDKNSKHNPDNVISEVEHMKKVVKYSVLLFLLFCTISIHSQDKRKYKWSGEWEGIPGNCPIYCIQRKFIIERKGLPTIEGNLIRSDVNHNGTQIQFITLGRSYLWLKEQYYLTLTGKNGYFIDDAHDFPAAVRVVMDDAVNTYLQWEEKNAVKKENNKSSVSTSTLNSLANAEKDWEQQKKETYNRLLASADNNIAQKNYDKALKDIKMALIWGSTPEGYAAEKKIKQLIKERDENTAKEKKEKAKSQAEAEKLLKEKRKAPDKKILFAGNPGYRPYPNPYDKPDNDKPVNKNPRKWNDFPENINDESALKKLYDDAIRGHDGYRLLQLANKRFFSGIKFVEVKDILPHVYTIAKFNRDPWLMYHLGNFYRDALSRNSEYRFLPLLPGAYLKEAYNLSVLRKDPAPLDELYLLEKTYDLIPDMTEKDISKTSYEMTH